MEVRDVAIVSDDAQQLIRWLDQELAAVYGDENVSRVESHAFTQCGGVFLVAYDESNPVGCGAFRPIGDGVVEIKRMFVVDEHRGRGVARLVLNALEARARHAGFRQIVLETGDRQLAAIQLYESAGYCRIDPFGEYVDSPISVCFAKKLSQNEN